VTAVTIPRELADDVAARPEAYRPHAEPHEQVLNLHAGDVCEVIGPADGLLHVMRAGLAFTVLEAWALVGSVDGGPRPEVGQRVLVLAWEQRTLEGQRRPPSVERVICLCDEPGPMRGEITTTWAADDDVQGGYYVTRWALLPPAAEPDVAEVVERIQRAAAADTRGPYVPVIEPADARCWVCNEPDHGQCPECAEALCQGQDAECSQPVNLPDVEPRRWRTGISWGAAASQMATLVEEGTGEPDEDGRRPDDRLVGALPADDAELVVDAVNARSAGIDTKRWALREELDDADAATIKAWRERDDALAEVERLRVSAAVLAEVRSIFGGCRADDVAAIAAGLWAAAGESGRTARGDR
jgi:hypothetical protein